VLTPREFAFWPDPENPEYGLLLCEDERGTHWTLRGSPDLVQRIRDAPLRALSDAEVGGVWEQRLRWPMNGDRLSLTRTHYPVAEPGAAIAMSGATEALRLSKGLIGAAAATHPRLPARVVRRSSAMLVMR
jgi:hypothetical protein